MQWFADATLNITQNCLDRHVAAGHGDRPAYLALTENNELTTITYAELLEQVSRAANTLTQLGVEKGDRVVIYMPLAVEQVVAMLACARIGAIHSVVFAGFSSPALRLRLEDTQAKLIITGTWTQRRGKQIDLLSVVREARTGLPHIEHTLVWRRDQSDAILDSTQHELDWKDQLALAHPDHQAVPMRAEEPLFILYTSGTTGRPKGIVHTIAGYALGTHLTTQYTFDLHPDRFDAPEGEGDRYWCTADPGWITGHSYMVYGPLSVGVTSVIAEGAPDYPDAGRWWEIVDRLKVTVLYTAPTAIRLLMRAGDDVPAKYDLSSLRVIGSVGEPINPAAWHWVNDHVGRGRAAIVDTFWQTETGAHMLVTLPSLPQKPGMAGKPMFGIEPVIVDDHGHPVPPNSKGFLCIRHPWPSMMRTCWNNPERFNQYWSEYSVDGQPVYFTGDMAIQDDDGYIQVLGRSDDVLNVAGHRLGTAEVENALVSHPSVTEAAVIAIPDELTGEALHACVTLGQGWSDSPELQHELREHVKGLIGRFAHIGEFTVTPKLPKTRSGKIMRRVLRAQVTGQDVGDVSTLED